MTSKPPVFLRDIAEDALTKAIAKRIGCDPDILDSETTGVIAIARLDSHDRSRLDWQEVASVVARETGIGVVCVANCHWNMVDDCDEEATLIAFDVPGLPEDYRDDCRNEIEPVDPATAPTEAEFKRYRRAKQILGARLKELDAAITARKLAELPSEEIGYEIVRLFNARRDLEVLAPNPVYVAIETLDFDKFIALSAEADKAPAAPGV